MIEDEKSLLPLVHFDADHTWQHLLELCPAYLDGGGKTRLERLLGGTVATVGVEYHYIDKDYRDTFSGFHSKKFVTPSSRCIRLHFFRQQIAKAKLRASTIPDDAYVGYAVLRPTRPNCLGRTFLDPRRISGVAGALCRCRETVHVQGTALQVEGFPFISQDADATVCAESATWMVLRYFSNRYPAYREVHPFQVTCATQNYAFGRRVYPSRGLELWQMAETLRREGFSPMIYSRSSFPHIFEDLLYTYIESGFPVFAGLAGHVVVAIGHRSDYTKIVPLGEAWTKTSHFNEAFVVNDDNSFPYQRIEREAKEGVSLVSPYRIEHIQAFAVPLPEKVFLSAEAFALLVQALVLKDSKFGIAQQSAVLNQKPLLVRQFLTSCRSFKRSIHRRGMGSPLVAEIYHNLPLPHFIWVCELTTPDLYVAGAQRVLGEVIWDATRNPHEHAGFIAVHYPEKLWVDVGSAFNELQRFTEWPITDSVAYPLLRSNLVEI
ncbi:MAG: hypothetical protein QM691_12760 [Opitutaceae bacterium]